MRLQNEGVTVTGSRELSEFFKGIAVFMVVLVHTHQCFRLSGLQNLIPRFCQMGCQIFFVLSSYGLCHSFSAKRPTWFSHMKKRISKLAVGYWGAILLYAVYRVGMAFLENESLLQALNIPGIILNALFLNGLIPIPEINNGIVRGGWYVGTTVILYALFPLLYKLYFAGKSKTWERCRAACFSTAVFFISAATVILAGQIHPALVCENDTYMYYSFINQLTPFALGIVLFDISRCPHNAKADLFCSVLLWVAAFALFFSRVPYAFVFCPSVVALAFVLLFRYVLHHKKAADSICKNTGIVIRAIRGLGAGSYPIYLTHPFIVYGVPLVGLRFLRPICSNDFLWYLILLPLMFLMSCIAGRIYGKCICRIKIN